MSALQHESDVNSGKAIGTFADSTNPVLADAQARPGRLEPLRTLAEARLASATASELVSVYVTQVDPRAASLVIKCVSRFLQT